MDYRRSAAKAVQDGTSRLTRDPLASDALHSPAAQILKMHGSWSCSRSTRQCNDEHGMAMATRSVSLHPQFPAPTAQNNDSQNLALSTCNPSVSNIHSHSQHPYKGHNACPSIHPQASRPLTPKAHAANPHHPELNVVQKHPLPPIHNECRTQTRFRFLLAHSSSMLDLG